MMDIDTLLTLDADEPALRRGIAELLGWKDFIIVGGVLFGLTPGTPLGQVRTEVPDWPHSVDAALGLVPEWLYWEVGINNPSHTLFAARIGITPYYEGEATTPALAICRAWLASKHQAPR